MPDELDRLRGEIDAAQANSTVLPPKPKNDSKPAAEGLQAGAEITGGILGGLMFGYAFDAMFNTKPYGIAVGIVLGMIAGFYGVWRALKPK
jgi:F0F1-type ATP synthase assembly protein I